MANYDRIGHVLAQQTYDGGYRIVKTHRMPELYEEPNRFKPERWATLDRSPYEYLPFSAGRHMCIGASFATQEMKVVLAMLLQRYRLALVPNAKISSNVPNSTQAAEDLHLHKAERGANVLLVEPFDPVVFEQLTGSSILP